MFGGDGLGSVQMQAKINAPDDCEKHICYYFMVAYIRLTWKYNSFAG